MCSGYVRGSHPLPHGCGGASKTPRELCSPLQLPPRAFRGGAAVCSFSAVPLVHKKKEKIDPRVKKFTSKTAPGFKQTVVAGRWGEGGRMIHMEKQ